MFVSGSEHVYCAEVDHAVADPVRSPMEYSTVSVRSDGGVMRVALDRPDALNATTRAMGRELATALRAATADEAVRVVVLTGEGRAFSSGADLKDARPKTLDGEPDLGANLQQVYNPLILELRRLPLPVIAAVNGPAVGFGCALACACDLIVASESAYFLLAFARVGLVTDGGTSLTVPARVGLARAIQLSMLAEKLPARQALDWGLINDVAQDEQFDSAVDDLASRLARGPRGAYAGTKALFNRRLLPDLEAQLAAEASEQFRRGVSWEYAEGVRAFAEKRSPDFSRGPAERA